MYEEALGKIGLTEGETTVYLALLETGPGLAGGIMKKSGLQSSTVYHCLEKLLDKGLVSFVIKSNRKYYEATDPERLLGYLAERQKKLEEEKMTIKGILPELSALRKASGKPLSVNVYQGYNGLKNVFEDMLAELTPGGEYMDFGVSGLFRQVMPHYWSAWQRQKRKGKIRSRCIFDESVKAKDSVLIENYVGTAKFLPEKYYSAVDTMIYGVSVVLFVWTAKPPFAIVMKNEDIAKSYRNQFEVLWKAAKK